MTYKRELPGFNTLRPLILFITFTVSNNNIFIKKYFLEYLVINFYI